MTGRWLLRKPSADATARVFCFPYSGMGASMFSRWPRSLGDVDVCLIQPPGRENRSREPHFGDYASFASTVAEYLEPYLDVPFVFFGHCAGALPAFETAYELASRGLPTPSRLFVSAQVAPHDCPHDRFLDLSDAELKAELENLAVLRGGSPHPALIELALEVLHQDLEVNRVYRRSEPVSIPSPITVVHWSADVEVTAAQLEGWKDYSASTDFVTLDGGHYEFLAAPQALLDLLQGS
ncbi:Surfactin synthase thioesterase subunit [Amycolatopsis xylanica]|uniref:Surfactin synthase thioesterase subunit n=1 Tax=Amycolatopsis xylanica TaxID=589385 RepID=A0A1H3DA75_9PSEU|nr:thioesterase domain-containing protein [Amycolatopsis xylanica]SDX63412.1 Surfactin synthase thioesterase subunit [Amycolatopsis xylanica]